MRSLMQNGKNSRFRVRGPAVFTKFVPTNQIVSVPFPGQLLRFLRKAAPAKAAAAAAAIPIHTMGLVVSPVLAPT